MELSDRLAGAVWGHLIGDAVGVPYEFKSPEQIKSVHFGVHGTHAQPPGTWSDDGALMLACLDSLLRTRKPDEPVFDAADQAARFLAWQEQNQYTPDGDPLFDIGGGTASGLARVKVGVSPEKAGGTDDRNNGNGSLMRILPLALVERDINDAELADHTHRSSAITHGHPDAQAACALYVLVARHLLRGWARAEALAAARTSLRQVYGERTDGALRLAALDKLESWTERAGRGYVIDSFWSAWDAFAGAGSYREAIERAIRYGHDTDTTACIAGGLAGIRFGRAGIPDHWLAKMRGVSIVEPIVSRLLGDQSLEAHRSPKPAAVALPNPVPPARPHAPGELTSEANQIRVDWVHLNEVPGLTGAPGGLGMTFLPGRHGNGRMGEHRRDLQADLARLRDHWRVDTLVILVEGWELAEAGVPGIVAAAEAHGIKVVRFPIVDDDVPHDPELFRKLLEQLLALVRDGRRVVIACRGGLGRTGTVVACLLREGGLDADAAVALTRKTRRLTIQTTGQEQFIASWTPSSGVAPTTGASDDLPFPGYKGGGRIRLGRPRQGDVTARHGYGPPVFGQCGYVCVYCGLDMRGTFEGWLQLSVDHVIPRQMNNLGYPADLIEDIANLVTCCRACNDFGNHFTVTDPPPTSDEAFFDLRDRVFRQRRSAITARRAEERAVYERLSRS